VSGAGAPRVVVVTGAAQGIGRAFAERFAQAGDHVVVADVQRDKAGQVAHALEGDGEGLGVEMDVSDAGSVRAAVGAAVERFGRVDVLINNAALFSTIEMKPFEQISPEEWRRVIDVNLTGTFLCCQAVAGPMRTGGGGAIVNVSSSTVLMGRPLYAHYVSSKAGVVGLTRALARELGEAGVTVNAIMPGSIETEVRRDSVSPAQAREIVARQAIHQRLRPDDIVGAAVFLASPEARMITGQTVVVDGGLSFV
jgi:3-oxoacyl-[acyl-carrier protein] reductase